VNYREERGGTEVVSPLDLFELSFALFLISNEVNYCLSKHAVRLGLSLLELQLLWTIVRFGETTMIDIARLIARPKQEFASALESLEADGLVAKTYHEETNKCVITATPQGKAMIDRMTPCAKAACGFRNLDGETIKGFIEQAYKMVSAFRGAEFVDRAKY